MVNCSLYLIKRSILFGFESGIATYAVLHTTLFSLRLNILDSPNVR